MLSNLLQQIKSHKWYKNYSLRFSLFILDWFDMKFKKLKKTIESCGIKSKMCVMHLYVL